MKKIILFVLMVCTSSLLMAQVAIKRQDVSSVSAILDFATNTTDGIVLPAVSSAASVSAVNGMILFDRNDERLKYYQNGNWVMLSDTGDASKATAVNPSMENLNSGAVIAPDGGEPNDVLGVLELRSNSKAMVLPKVADPHINIPSPIAGTMVYDTVSQSVALFDGLAWNYLVEDKD